MPKPTPRSYCPTRQGAKCFQCPLAYRGNPSLPVPSKYASPVNKAKAVIVLESPDGESKYKGKAMQGRATQQLAKDLANYGLPENEYHAIYRIACTVPPAKRTESNLRKAAAACLPRVQNELAQLPKVSILYLGKWAPVGLILSKDHKAALEIKLTHSVIRYDAMALTHPAGAYFTRPAGRAEFQVSLRRFVDYALRRERWPQWSTNFILKPSEQALEALKSMGPEVAADVETLGTDPLVDPITAIGISDGKQTVSLNWASYENRFGEYHGIETSTDPLAVKLRAQIQKTLASRTVVGQNIVYDLLAFERLGIKIQKTEDTLDGAKILDPELPAGLETLGARYLKLPSRWKTEFRAGRDDDAKGASEFSESPLEKLLDYNAKDAWVTIQIWQEIKKLLAQED